MAPPGEEGVQSEPAGNVCLPHSRFESGALVEWSVCFVLVRLERKKKSKQTLAPRVPLMRGGNYRNMGVAAGRRHSPHHPPERWRRL